MEKNLRNRKFPRRSNLYLSTFMLGDASAIQLDSPSCRGGEKQGRGGRNLPVLLSSPLHNRLPHHGSSPKEEGREQMEYDNG